MRRWSEAALFWETGLHILARLPYISALTLFICQAGRTEVSKTVQRLVLVKHRGPP